MVIYNINTWRAMHDILRDFIIFSNFLKNKIIFTGNSSHIYHDEVIKW